MNNNDILKLFDNIGNKKLRDAVDDIPSFLPTNKDAFADEVKKMVGEYKKFKLTKNKCKYYGYIHSPLNYTGGKYKLLPQIIPLFPKDIRTFVDLFCGGCNVGININAEHIIFNDTLKPLIDLYKAFQSHTNEEILSFINNRIKEFEIKPAAKDSYIRFREYYNKEKNPLDLFVLTAYSFCNQIRFNKNNDFNMPFGKGMYNKNMGKKLIMFLNAIREKSIDFQSVDFEIFDYSNLDKKDFVYCDPPYLITNAVYNENRNGLDGWDDEREKSLLCTLDKLHKKNIRFGLSNVLTSKGKTNDILIQWCEDNKDKYFVHHLNNNYSNCNYHTKNRDKTSTDEVLITNVEPPKVFNLFEVSM